MTAAVAQGLCSAAAAAVGRLDARGRWVDADPEPAWAGQPDPDRTAEPVDASHLFDWASVSKVATTALVLALADDGRLGLDDPVSSLVPVPDPAITTRDLLTHRAGLWPWQPLYLAATDRASALRVISALPQRFPRHQGSHYSDLSMILLGALAEELTGLPLRTAMGTWVAGPLGVGAAYSPVPRETAVATSLGDHVEATMVADGDPYPIVLTPTHAPRWRTERLRGECNDGNAHHVLGGAAGHAGLFGTALDLARLGSAFLPGGPLLSDRIRAEALEPSPGGQALGLRWSPARGGPAFWHPGFTGTRVLVHPTSRTVVVLLTNRLYLRGASRSEPRVEPVWQRLLELTVPAC